MTNQSGCRSNRSGSPGSFTERPCSRQNRVNQGYSAPRTGSSSRSACPVTEQNACGCEGPTVTSEICVSSEKFPIGMTYTPMQQWKNLYCPSTGLQQGTIFADLDKPFVGRRTAR